MRSLALRARFAGSNRPGGDAPGRGLPMTELARDLYLLAAAFGLALVVSHAGMPVLAAAAFAAVGGVGALQLERAGLPIGSAVLLAVALGGVAGALTGVLVER